MPPLLPPIGDWLLAIPAHSRLFPPSCRPSRTDRRRNFQFYHGSASRLFLSTAGRCPIFSCLQTVHLYTGSTIVQWVNNGRLSVRSLPSRASYFSSLYPAGDRRRQNERVRWPSLVPLLEMLKHGQPTPRSRFDGNDQTTFIYFDCRYVY